MRRYGRGYASRLHPALSRKKESALTGQLESPHDPRHASDERAKTRLVMVRHALAAAAKSMQREGDEHVCVGPWPVS